MTQFVEQKLRSQARDSGSFVSSSHNVHTGKGPQPKSCISGLQKFRKQMACPSIVYIPWPSPQPIRSKFRYVLHLFSGVRRHGDLHSIIQDLPTPDGYVFYPASIDIVLRPDKGDLSSHEAQRFWLDASFSGAIFGAIGGPPCETWSVARDKPEFRRESHANDLVTALNEKTEEDSLNFSSWRYVIKKTGPRPIRDGMNLLETIWAAFPVRIRDLKQLDCANQLLLFMVLLVITQAARYRCCILEHPAISPGRPYGIQPASIFSDYTLCFYSSKKRFRKFRFEMGGHRTCTTNENVNLLHMILLRVLILSFLEQDSICV